MFSTGLFASDVLNIGFVRMANNSLASILSVNLSHNFVLVALGNLTDSVDELFSFDGTLLSDACISSSDFSLLANDSGAISVDEVLSFTAWLSDARFLFEIEVFSDLTA